MQALMGYEPLVDQSVEQSGCPSPTEVDSTSWQLQ